MKRIQLIFALLLFLSSTNAQDKFFTKTGKISLDATAPKSLENIDAINNTAVCVVDTKTGDIQFSVLMKGFEFERALMMEHFNENYVESDKFPKSIFKGVITNNASILYGKDGSYPAKVKGKMTIHGETKDIDAEGKISFKQGKLILDALFKLQLSDYKISIPQLVSDKVATAAKIKVECTLEALAK